MDNELVKEYLAARVAWKKAEEHLAELSARLTKQMEADQRKSYRWNEDGRTHLLTYVQNHSTVVDEPGLRRALTAKIYDKYTKRVLDRAKMENAIDAGEVDMTTVARFTEIRASKPFLKYTEKDS